MRKVMYIGQGYSVIEIDGEMKVSWAEGIERKIVYHDISEELFERLKRSEEDAKAMIVRGFAYPISKELPVEYAVEMNNLINLELEGAIG